MQKWQYYTATFKKGMLKWHWASDEMKKMGFSEGLNFLGGRGWEMCSSEICYSGGGTSYVYPESYEYYFKRPLND